MYNSVSIDNTIAKIIRDTRLQDNSYIADFYEWIPEAMAMMQTNAPLVRMCADVNINYHMGKLPCGLILLEAVEYEGKRLRYNTGVRKAGLAKAKVTSTDISAFTSVVSTTTNSVTGNLMYVSDAEPPAVENTTESYQLYLDHIATTFEDGTVRIHFRTTATDSRGLPLIPDHADYKEALYWFVRMKMIQAGYADPMYGNDDRMPLQRWELHAGRAIADITYPTPDEKEAQLAMHVRFVPPTDYYESFFNSGSPEPPIGL